jgi:hypothetical protein
VADGKVVVMGNSEATARALAAETLEHGIVARVCFDARFGWIVRAWPKFHDGDVVLRTYNDLMDVLMEAEWSR